MTTSDLVTASTLLLFGAALAACGEDLSNSGGAGVVDAQNVNATMLTEATGAKQVCPATAAVTQSQSRKLDPPWDDFVVLETSLNGQSLSPASLADDVVGALVPTNDLEHLWLSTNHGGQLIGKNVGTLHEATLARDADCHVLGYRSLDAPQIAELGQGTQGSMVLHPKFGFLFDSEPRSGNQRKFSLTLRPSATSTIETTFDLSQFGVGLYRVLIIPVGFPGAGKVMALEESRKMFELGLEIDEGGVPRLTEVTPLVEFAGFQVADNPNFTYVAAGNVGVEKPSVLYLTNVDDAWFLYELDERGAPVLASGRSFVRGIPRPSYVTVDSVSGDILFLYRDGRMTVLRGLKPPARLL